MSIPYGKPGIKIGTGHSNDPALVRALQRDLRALGYLRAGIDGHFGPQTERAISALQLDLLNLKGSGAPINLSKYNDDGAGGRRIAAVTGALDDKLAACLASMVADTALQQLPASSDPGASNTLAMEAIAGMASNVAPTPFVIAIVRQESQGQHYNVPAAGDDDKFVTLGLDRNDASSPDRITSRGYGVGQYTFFHHPISAADMANCVTDPVLNVRQAFKELRAKFDGFVLGPSDKADDRLAEHPQLSLRLCKYQPSDPLYMRDCKVCALATRKVEIERGSPFYAGASGGYQPDQYYLSAEYSGVPDRADFLCDWPYAARRYNGSGNNSFHYQAKILLNLLR